MKHGLGLMFMLLCFSLFAQERKVKKYYCLVNKAELAIVEGKIKNASQYFLKSFKLMNPNSYDLQNAFVCAIYLKDSLLYQYYGELLIKRGANSNFFKQNKFGNIVENPIWKRFIEKNYLKFNTYYQANYDSVYRKTIDSLFELDQNSRFIYDTITMKKIDDQIQPMLVNLLESKGYPHDAQIGIWVRNDTFFRHNNPLDLMLLHQFKAGNGDQFLPNLKKAVFEGKMHPMKLSFFSGLVSDSTLNFGCHYWNQIIYAQINNVLLRCDEKKINQVNKNRKKYFLEPISDLEKKLFFYYFKNKDFRLNTVYSFISMEDKSNNSLLEYTKYGFKTFKILDSNKLYFK
jgi:hypothetical protein